ncbi:hypothetical protein [Alteromonas sp. MMG017]|uniref:hypothetical protein n=1 Tax=Alteromonas sp. MMG017 TaxID=2822692 RepID=UPI001B3A1A84|nr:hypothetical protein [Alteromonas sp. MMG017]
MFISFSCLLDNASLKDVTTNKALDHTVTWQHQNHTANKILCCLIVAGFKAPHNPWYQKQPAT